MNKKKIKKYINFEKPIIDEDSYLEKIEKPKKVIKERKKLTDKNRKRIEIFMAIILTVTLIYVLLVTTSQLPSFGSSGNPSDNIVAQRYIEDGMYETGSVNLVSGMILDYRAFDTFGESSVLFLAVISVIVLLKKDKTNYDKSDEEEEKEDNKIIIGTGITIMRELVRYLFPFIMVFGIYVILNGHLSPGGGFSGGAIIGVGLIMYSVAFDTHTISDVLSYDRFVKIITSCMLVYFVLKAYSFFTGANHLDSIIGPGNIGNILSAGLILPLNICVGIVVSLTIYGFYSLFVRGDI